MSRLGIEQSTNYFLKKVWLGNIICLEIRHQLWTKDKRFSSCLNVHVIPLFLDSELMVKLCSQLCWCKYDVAYLKLLASEHRSGLSAAGTKKPKGSQCIASSETSFFRTV